MLEMNLDPNGAYSRISPDLLLEACGLIPFFVSEAQDEETAEATLEAMERVYEFSFSWRADGVVLDEQGRWVSVDDEDPALDPYAHLTTATAVDVRIYPYGFVIVSQGDDVLATRMD